MLFLRSWLEEYVDLSKLSEQQLSDLISLKSGEVEESLIINDWFDNKVLVGRIQNLQKHPDADRLNLFEVNLGEKLKPIQIVSAAPNVKEGLLVPVATIGARLAYLNIAERKMRGKTSQGMCLGKSELMLETEFSSGLWEIEDELKANKKEVILGQSICKAFPELFPTQSIIDLKYLQDKIGPLGSHLGLALELAIILEDFSLLKPKGLRLLQSKIIGKGNHPKLWEELQLKLTKIKRSKHRLKFEDQTDYTNTFLTLELNLREKNYSLPHQLQQKMYLTQQNLVGSLADLSNYLMLDVGQPSHFFSIAKLAKLNSQNEQNLNLDWKIEKLSQATKFKGLGQLKETVLPPGLEVLKQNQKILAIPAISGGQVTKTEFEDTKVIIEVANFPRERVARSTFKIGYRSNGSRLWNSGVKTSQKLVWLLHFIEILEEYNPNFDLKLIDFWINPKSDLATSTSDDINFTENCLELLNSQEQNRVSFDLKYLADRLDKRSENKLHSLIQQKLDILGRVKENYFYPNPFYSHVASQEDLLFEVAELIGFENLETEYLKFKTNIERDDKYHQLNKILDYTTSLGFSQIISRPLLAKNKTYSFLSKNSNIHPLEAISSQRQDENYLQERFFTNLIESIGQNIRRGYKNPKIFEVGKLYTYNQDNPKNPLNESLHLELMANTEDPYIFTTFINTLLRRSSADKLQHHDFENEIGKGYLYKLISKNDELLKIKLIEIKNKIKKTFNIPISKKIFYLDLDLSHWDYSYKPYQKYTDESYYTGISRNYSFYLDKSTNWHELQELIRITPIKETKIIAKPIERLNGSDLDVINFSVEFVNYERNLTNQEITEWEKTIKSKFLELDQKIVAR